PNDHTSGASAGRPTPRAYMADNDLALARIVEALSRSPYWKNTVVFALEDDAQDGPDHVDSHRSPMLVISAYNRARSSTASPTRPTSWRRSRIFLAWDGCRNSIIMGGRCGRSGRLRRISRLILRCHQ